jgi:aryl-alcohol dehydrogenase-like predicted oxidoreductase
MELRIAENHSHAGRILNTVLDCGINFIDTSQDYGASETLIGEHIAHRRGEYYIATKCGCNLEVKGAGRREHIFTREHIINNLEDSLRKLKTDYIDFWQLHCVVPSHLPGGVHDDTVQAMLDMKRAGKVRYIGVSFKGGKEGDALYPIEHQERFAVEMAEWGCFDGFQMSYGLMIRDSEKKMEQMKQMGMGIVARGVLRKYYPYYDERIKRAKLHELYEHGETESSFFVRYVMGVECVDCMIIGSGSAEHIRSNALAAQRGALAKDVAAEAVRRLDVSAPGFNENG